MSLIERHLAGVGLILVTGVWLIKNGAEPEAVIYASKKALEALAGHGLDWKLPTRKERAIDCIKEQPFYEVVK